MASRKNKSSFTSDELAVLQQAFDLACADLKLNLQRSLPREQLGALIFEIAATGESDCAVLRRQSVRRFRSGIPARPTGIEVASVLVLSGRRTGPPPHRSGKR